MTNYTKKAIKGATSIFLAGIVSAGLAYLIRIIMARNLIPADYGLFYSMLTFILFFSVFRDAGLNTALTKYIAEYETKKDYSKIKTLILSSLISQLILSLILFSILVLISGFLSTYYFKTEISASLFRLLSLYIFPSVLISIILSILSGFQSMGTFSIMEPLRNATTLILMAILFKLGQGLNSPIIAYLIGSILSGVIMGAILKKYSFIMRFKLKNLWKTTKQLFNFGIPVMFTGIGHMAIAYIDILILTYFASLEAVGVYNIILPTAIMFLFFSRSISTVIFPMISELWIKKDKKRVIDGIKMIYKYTFIFTIPLLLTIFVFSGLFLKTFFGEEYAWGILAFRILLIGVLFYMIAEINNAIISGIGRPKEVTKIIFIIAGVNIFLNILLIPTFKLTGAAFATSFSYFIALVLSMRKINKMMKVLIPWNKWIKTFISGVFFVGSIYLIKGVLTLTPLYESLLSLIFALMIYILMVFILKIINIKEIKGIIKRLD